MKKSINISGLIGADVTAQSVKRDLDAIGKASEIELTVNSRGGSFFDGTAIYAMLIRHPAKIIGFVDGLAASAASAILCAANTITVPASAFIMIHNPSGSAGGSSDSLRKTANLIDKTRETLIDIYHRKTSLPKARLGKMMDVETWMTGEQAVELGFADKLSEPVAIAACLDPEMFVHAPTELVLKDSGLIQEIRAEWRDAPELQAEFLDFESFMAYKKNAGNITIIADRVYRERDRAR